MNAPICLLLMTYTNFIEWRFHFALQDNPNTAKLHLK